MALNQLTYQRMDKGIKRGKRTVKTHEVENAARAAARKAHAGNGQYVSTYTVAERQAAINDAIHGLSIGIPAEDVAIKHGIPRSTIYSWLLDNEVAQEHRSRFFHFQIGQQLEAMAVAATPLDLARARDLRRAWAETAAVRDHHNYGPHIHQTVENITDLGDRLRRADERVIDGHATVIAPQQASKSKIAALHKAISRNKR